MKHFRETTKGKPLVMGRKTWESFPKRPLPGRPNLVVTRNANYDAPGGEVFTTIDDALARAKVLAAESGAEEIMVIGGAEIYAQTLGRADRIYLTEVHAEIDGDARFPALDDTVWRETSREHHAAGPEDTADYSIVVLDRREPASQQP